MAFMPAHISSACGQQRRTAVNTATQGRRTASCDRQLPGR